MAGVRNVISVLALACATSSCGSGASGSAKLRVLNAVNGSVNVIVDGATVSTNVQYPTCVFEVCQALSGYVSVKSGRVSFALEGTPNTTTNLVPPQFQHLTLTANTQNTFVWSPPAFGSTASSAGFQLANDDVPAANPIKIRIANADPIGPSLLSAYVVPTGTMPSGNPTISNVMFGSASSYVTLPPGSYTVWFAFPEKNPVGGSQSPYTTWGPTTYLANQNFTVVLMQEIDIDRAVILADN